MPYAAPNRVNDFVIKIGTVNGTGSASANGLLMKAVFRSGVPVVGKNYFPSTHSQARFFPWTETPGPSILAGPGTRRIDPARSRDRKSVV
jgi:hypothetical protein